VSQPIPDLLTGRQSDTVGQTDRKPDDFEARLRTGRTGRVVISISLFGLGKIGGRVLTWLRDSRRFVCIIRRRKSSKNIFWSE
jgi:hypothetical protein